jgi:hypothetical protein
VLKQYIYLPEHLGLQKWPSNSLRLPGIEITEDPSQADLFVFPPGLSDETPDKQRPFLSMGFPYRLPYFRGNEAKHVFFDNSDYEPLYRQPSLFIRCNTRTWFLNEDPNTISWPWGVEDYAECVDVLEGGFKYDVSFQGWNYSGVRQAATRSCLDSGIKCDFNLYPDFCGYIWDQPEGLRRRAEFRRSMRESRIMLCPESIPGVFPYRFFEALSAGRVPLLICTNYVLPQREHIPYERFCFFIGADRAPDAGAVATGVLSETSDERLIEMGREGREYWDRYLNRDKWPALMAQAVIEKIQCLTAA